jgi:hypothetical protein
MTEPSTPEEDEPVVLNTLPAGGVSMDIVDTLNEGDVFAIVGPLVIDTLTDRITHLNLVVNNTRDLLHGQAVASGHRMTGLSKQTVPVPTRTQREPAAYRRNSRFLPHYRAVARSRRPHRNPCHCRVTDRQRSSPPLVCWGPASHRFRSRPKYVGPRQKRSVGHPVRPQYGGFSQGVSAQPPPVRSSVPTRCRNTPHSPEGGGMRSYLYHFVGWNSTSER